MGYFEAKQLWKGLMYPSRQALEIIATDFTHT